MWVGAPAPGVLSGGRGSHRDKQGIVEFLRPSDVVTPDHNMAEHSVLSSSASHAPAAPPQKQNTVCRLGPVRARLLLAHHARFWHYLREPRGGKAQKAQHLIIR